MTALQNSREFRNWTRAGIRNQSSLCRQCHSSLGASSLVGRDEYRPLSPVASTCTGAKFKKQLNKMRLINDHDCFIDFDLGNYGLTIFDSFKVNTQVLSDFRMLRKSRNLLCAKLRLCRFSLLKCVRMSLLTQEKKYFKLKPFSLTTLCNHIKKS